jgi:peptidoglycan L-alanyl-D-glutamate endopeptidase CwlK
MHNYSKNSRDKLNTAEADLITVFTEVIEDFDNSILHGHRSSAIQMDYFKQGRALVNGQWEIANKRKVVTYCDGTMKKSNHNYVPSRAVDALPYPINGEDRERMYFFAGWVMKTAKRLYKERKISHMIRWGGDWDSDTEVRDQTFMDLAHFEIIL